MGAVISFHAVRCTLSLRLRPSEKEIPGSGCNSCPGIASIGPPSFRSGSLYSQRMAGPGTCTALVLGMLACLYVSLWFYARHLPERWFPGRFDIVGNSHQARTGPLTSGLSATCWRTCLLLQKSAIGDAVLIVGDFAKQSRPDGGQPCPCRAAARQSSSVSAAWYVGKEVQ